MAKPPANHADIKSMTFEKALKELEGIVNRLERGDVEEGLRAASSIGDDRLQMESQGRVVPDSFTHGSSAQRVSWFQTGLESGDIDSCNTFDAMS